LQTGTYYARVSNNAGCILTTERKQINISSIPVPGFTVPNRDQCLIGNNFTFTNTSTNLIGPMRYRWIFGDGMEAFTRDVTHAYTKAGTYHVKLIVSSNTICADSSSLIIHVFQNAIPLFTAEKVCINQPIQIINNTADTMNTVINYQWSFGNGQFSNLRNPPPPVYPFAGIYDVKLTVSTVQCPTPLITAQQYLIVEDPREGISYPPQVAVENLPLSLQARTFGEVYLWKPAVGLNDPAIANPEFRGIAEQLFTIEIITESGCLTIDTQLVKIVKQISIYVPTAFTPDGDGENDLLRPTMYGIKTLNYFRVYNRWGQLMFLSNNSLQGWDGRFTGTAQASQTYVWSLEAIGADGNMYIRKGSSILIR